ncbi:hypothetical protein BJX62DRAFT_241534 [Aspergillus germanicus]
MLFPGTCIWDIVREAGFDEVLNQYVQTTEEDGSLFPLDPATMFFGGDEGVPQEMIEKGIGTLVRFPMSCLTTPTAGSAWREIPSTYVLTQKDYAVPRVSQDIMVAKVNAEGVELRTEDFDACHSIFILREKEMVELAIQEIENMQILHLELLQHAARNITQCEYCTISTVLEDKLTYSTPWLQEPSC